MIGNRASLLSCAIVFTLSIASTAMAAAPTLSRNAANVPKSLVQTITCEWVHSRDGLRRVCRDDGYGDYGAGEGAYGRGGYEWRQGLPEHYGTRDNQSDRIWGGQQPGPD